MTRRRVRRVRVENLDEVSNLLDRVDPVAHLHGDLSVTLERAPPEDHVLAAGHHRARLGTPIPFGLFAVPRVVEVRGDQLVWRDLEAGTFPDSEGLLGRFVALRDAPPEQIADFARLYGMLAICEHGQPSPHVRTIGKGYLIVCPRQRDGDGGVEPLAAWRALAQKAAGPLDEMARHPERRPLHVDAVGSNWIRPAQVTLGVVDGKPCFSSLAGDGPPFGLFAGLAVQLLAVALGARSVPVCDGCHELFFEDRRQARVPGRRMFCRPCGRATAGRLAARDYRARKRKGSVVHPRGTPRRGRLPKPRK